MLAGTNPKMCDNAVNTFRIFCVGYFVGLVKLVVAPPWHPSWEGYLLVESLQAVRDHVVGYSPIPTPSPPIFDLVRELPTLIGDDMLRHEGFFKVAERTGETIAGEERLPVAFGDLCFLCPSKQSGHFCRTEPAMGEVEVEERDPVVVIDGEIVQRQVAVTDAERQVDGTRSERRLQPSSDVPELCTSMWSVR